MPIRFAKENSIPIISELELGYHFCKGIIVAVTGTNGKSTVVSLLGEILRRAKIPVKVCGNIGNSLSGEVGAISKKTVVILEVSSFQLEWISSFRPKIALILNMTADHLDRHSSFKEYINYKMRIFENQKPEDYAILNYDDVTLRGAAKSHRIRAKILYFSAKKKEKKLFEIKNTRLKGAHNLENILAAGLAAKLLGVKKASLKKSIEGFKPLGSRFEKVATIGGIDFINDSKATNIDSTRQALLSLERKAILIAGGKDKNLSYEEILPAVKKAVKKIILIGETTPKMRDIFKKVVATEESGSLEEAVRAAYESASSGETVLLSPMCSSFDMFKSYKERAEVFVGAVRKLKDEIH